MFDTFTVSDSTGARQTVWFRTVADAIPSVLDMPERQRGNPATDQRYRAILSSGDGRSPETAYPTGGDIGAEYAILRWMGLRRGVQALQNIRGCAFDVLDGMPIEGGPPTGARVWFLLGRGLPDYSGVCVMRPDVDRPQSGAPSPAR